MGIGCLPNWSATDPKKDLALLKIPGSNFPTLPIGESRKMSVMDSVLAMGYPMFSTIGYDVSAYDGKINAIREADHAPLLQIDANINPGNSGGPAAQRSRRSDRNRCCED